MIKYKLNICKYNKYINKYKMLNNKILKLIYTKNNFIKLLIICILAYIIYLLYYKINEEFSITSPAGVNPGFESYIAGESKTWRVPDGVTQATFTVIGGKGADGYSPSIGGYGGNVTTTISNLIPGTNYNIYVGNNGIYVGGLNYGGISSDTNHIYNGGGGGPFGGVGELHHL